MTTNTVTVVSEKPRVLSTASSGTRSRTDCIIVFPVRNSRVKNTAPRIAVTMKLMSPNCLMNDWENSFSLCVLVSADELANSASTARATSAARPGSLTLIRYQPTVPLPKARASSK